MHQERCRDSPPRQRCASAHLPEPATPAVEISTEIATSSEIDFVRIGGRQYTSASVVGAAR